MNIEKEYPHSAQATSAPVVLPDGSQKLPLGSGYITALIGSGAMANVYRIWNPQLETLRAVKLMKPDISAESRQRFQTEMKIMAALSHPNIIEIHSVGEWNSLSYIEMELIDGYTLSDIVDKKGSLPLHLCTALGIMISRALIYAHQKDYVLFGKPYHGIIHRDLKPSNLMVAKEGSVKLMDFGIARPVESSLMTMDGAVMGTMQYLAPEQIDGKNVGVAADIYALGAVLYEVLTGRKAFPQKNLSMLMAAKTSNDFLSLKLFRFNIPTALRDLIGNCMLFEPKKRPASVEVVLERIEQIHERITRDSPEKIVRDFLRTPLGQRTELAIKKSVPRAAYIVGLSCMLITGGLCILTLKPHKSIKPVTPTPVVNAISLPRIPDLKNSGSAGNSVVKAVPTPIRKQVVRTVANAHTSVSNVSGKAAPGFFWKNKGEAMETLSREAEAGNYENVVRLFGQLPADFAEDHTARLLLLRALMELGKRNEASENARKFVLDDGEYYLILAKLSFYEGKSEQGLKLLEKSVSVHTRLLAPELLRRDYLFYRALCLSRIFDRAPTQENRSNALDAWFEVKTFLRMSPDHAYFQKAVVEMQRIGDRLQHGNG